MGKQIVSPMVAGWSGEVLLDYTYSFQPKIYYETEGGFSQI